MTTAKKEFNAIKGNTVFLTGHFFLKAASSFITYLMPLLGANILNSSHKSAKSDHPDQLKMDQLLYAFVFVYLGASLLEHGSRHWAKEYVRDLSTKEQDFLLKSVDGLPLLAVEKNSSELHDLLIQSMDYIPKLAPKNIIYTDFLIDFFTCGAFLFYENGVGDISLVLLSLFAFKTLPHLVLTSQKNSTNPIIQKLCHVFGLADDQSEALMQKQFQVNVSLTEYVQQQSFMRYAGLTQLENSHHALLSRDYHRLQKKVEGQQGWSGLSKSLIIDLPFNLLIIALLAQKDLKGLAFMGKFFTFNRYGSFVSHVSDAFTSGHDGVTQGNQFVDRFFKTIGGWRGLTPVGKQTASKQKGLHVQLKYGHQSLDNEVHHRFKKGVNFVSGSNGCGKTTLMKAITGLIESSGTLTFDGLNLMSDARTQQMGYLKSEEMEFQTTGKKSTHYMMHYHHRNQPYLHALFQRDALDSSVAAHFKVNHQSAFTRAYAKCFDWFNELTDTHHYADLSLGQRKILRLGQVLDDDKPIWILDEPFSGLDAENQLFLKAFLLKAKDTVVIITCQQVPDFFAESEFANELKLDGTTSNMRLIL